MRLVDTHVHLNFPDLQSQLEDVAEEWRSANVVHLVHSCVHPGEFEGIRSIADRFPGKISLSVGLHPLDVEKWQDDSADRIRACAASDPRVVAIGEMGLDFFKATNRDEQCHVFDQQLAIAHSLDLPIIVHCRGGDAAEVMAQRMRRFWQDVGPVRGVMHCWGGTPEETKWFLDLGFHISFSGILTFTNASAAHVKASAACVPTDRILVETDCPFLTPVPHRGQWPNQPAHVAHVARTLAEVRGVSLEEIAEQTTHNACSLFGLNIDALEKSVV